MLQAQLIQDAFEASMGPRLSTGGSVLLDIRQRHFWSVLQWGPVSRRGGAFPDQGSPFLYGVASMGPRLSTGGSRLSGRPPGLDDLRLQWGPVSRRGGAFSARRARCPGSRSFNGAPSLDGGERLQGLVVRRCSIRASMGP